MVAALSEEGVQRRVEQRRVNPKALRRGRLLLAQRRLHEELLAAPPRPLDHLEGGPVAEPDLRQPVVEVLGLDRFSPGGRPLLRLQALDRRIDLRRRREQTAGVARPPALVFVETIAGALRARVDGDRAATLLVGLGERHLQLHGVLR